MFSVKKIRMIIYWIIVVIFKYAVFFPLDFFVIVFGEGFFFVLIFSYDSN